MTDYIVVERSAEIAAPAARVIELIDDLRAWQQWSPWEGLDPDLSRTYSGPDSGVGARYEWSGNRKAGAGTMQVTGVSDDGIDVALTFTKPFKSESLVRFDLVPVDGGTEVAWRISSPRTVGMRIADFFMNMDKTMGEDLEKGLRKLREVAEAADAAAPSGEPGPGQTPND